MEKLKKKPFALIGVNVLKHDPAKLKEVMVREKLNWRSFANRDGIAERWNSPGTPTYYVIDHEGRIRHKRTGNPGAKSLDLVLETLIKEAEEAKGRK